MAGGYPVKRVCIIGGRGRLGQALACEYADAGADVVILDREIYQDWAGDGADRAIARHFERDRQSSNSLLFVTSGLLDPRLPRESLLAVNYWLPRNVLSAVLPLGMQVVTFGTVMEAMPDAANAYIDSKRRLGEYVNSVCDHGAATHLQIHTLYGTGNPTPFMFLGQILTALRLNEIFRMTSGRQLREYHHVADDARAIRWLVESASTGTIALSHGAPVTLRQIADTVFEAFGKGELLRAGALPDPEQENYERIFEPLSFPAEVKFRESLPAIVEYMKSNLYPDCGTSERGA
jgi:nucleoside-diphosphate-sugar epimerase